MSSSIYEYRAAIHLNNTGVSLLEKRCYRQAMTTFCDAITVMKETVLQGERKACVFDPTPMRENIEQKLHRAAQCLSNPNPSSASMAIDLTINVISDDESALAVAGSREDIACQYSTRLVAKSKSVMHLVRMEPQEQQNVREHTVEAAICLYNYGQAYRCLSELETSAPYSSSLRARAHQFMRLALKMLSSSQSLERNDQTLCTLNGGDCSSRNSAFNRAVLLTAMSLKHLLQLASSQEQLNYYEQRLRSILPFLYTLASIEGECKVCAAGAA